MRRFKSQAGFTIVEIMSVVAIMGILAILVLPSIKVNTIRVKMSEAILAFGPCKGIITEIYLSGGDQQDGMDMWGCEIQTGKGTTYVGAVHTTPEGIIKVDLTGFHDGRLDSHTLTLTPLDATGNLPAGGGTPVVRWRCGFGPDGTDVLPQYLPNTCRGG